MHHSIPEINLLCLDLTHSSPILYILAAINAMQWNPLDIPININQIRDRAKNVCSSCWQLTFVVCTTNSCTWHRGELIRRSSAPYIFLSILREKQSSSKCNTVHWDFPYMAPECWLEMIELRNTRIYSLSHLFIYNWSWP